MEKKTSYLSFAEVLYSIYIILLQNEINVKEVTWSQISEFKGMLREEADKVGTNLYFPGNRDQTIRFFNDTRDKFQETENGVAIEEGVNPWHLIYDRSALTNIDLVLLLDRKDIVLKTLHVMGYDVQETKKLRSIEDYMSELKDTIDKTALEWDFDRCISLKKKYKELEWIAGFIEKNSKVKTKNAVNESK